MDDLLKVFNLTPHDAQMIGIWIIFFAVIYQLLSKFVFLPFLALAEARDEATAGSRALAEDKKKLAEQIAQEFDERMLTERRKLLVSRSESISSEKNAAQKLLEHEEAQAQGRIEGFRAELKSREEVLRRDVSGEASKLADLLLARIEGQLSNSGSGVN